MATKPKTRASAAIESSGGEEEKIGKIVEEVDRFFKSVHADIEDWKFSMEEYGDGTRIFVRFQIHINKAGASSESVSLKETFAKQEAVDEPVASPRVKPALPALEGRSAPGDPRDPGSAANRADLDLASFVEVWRSKRDRSKGGEYHKPGAPYMDPESDPGRATGEGGPGSPATVDRWADAERKVPGTAR
jgi:hypothetical protein